MTPDLIFQIANVSVLPFWLLLAIAPQWRGTQVLVHSIAIPVILGVLYTYLLGTALFGDVETPEGASFTSLTGVMGFFTVKIAALAGWVHYLVFDLFVGAWETRDATRRGVPRLVLIPCLFFTLMAGPLGLLLYLVARMVLSRGGVSLSEQQS